MPAHDFLDRQALSLDLDRPLMADVGESAPPIFVLGLHRSGTTYLYQLLTDYFRVATTQVYHVTHYKRLLHAEREGLVPAYHADIRAHLASRGIENRGIDKFPVGPEGLEEYAFILRKHGPHWGFSAGSAPLFDEMLRKLSHLQPDAPALLLKNPHDLGSASAILARYPNAKFVFIRRDPVRVLNSQFRNSFLYRRKPEPYLEMLLAGIPLWRFNFDLMRGLDKVLPDALYQQVLVRGLRWSIADQLHRHYRDLPRLPQASYVEVTYEDLLQDPMPVLRRIQDLVGLPFRDDPAPMESNPRLEPLLDGVAAVADDFRRELDGCPDAALVA
jgi:hypothetical protein